MKKFLRFANAALNGFAGMAVVVGAYWTAGFDFDSRGTTSVSCYLISVVAGLYLFAMTMSFTSSD